MVFSAQVALYRPFEYVKGNHRTALFMVQMLFLHNCLSDRLEENLKKDLKVPVMLIKPLIPA